MGRLEDWLESESHVHILCAHHPVPAHVHNGCSCAGMVRGLLATEG
jgi:hypothetical protein